MRRSREEIVSKILDVCINGANKTKIVYQSNLNSGQLTLIWIF